jgi:REP element-mobilizing transposase RayT
MWARVYFCATVGAVDEATIKAYIESQKWDEGEQGFQDHCAHGALSRL